MSYQLNETYFEPREFCPVCHSSASDIYKSAFTEQPVRGFIESHYSVQEGHVDWSMLEGTDFVLAECPQCDLIFQRAAPKSALLNHIYNEMIGPEYLGRLEHERLTIDNFDQIAGELMVIFRRLGKHPGDVTFLDFGFGYGRWARVARAMGATVYATETGDEKKAIASGIGVQIISDEEVDRMRFDIVHTEQVLEHVTDPGREFKRLAAATQGLLKVAIPRRRDLRRLLASKGMPSQSPYARLVEGGSWSDDDASFIAVEPLEHLNAFSRKTFDWLAQANGMEVVSRERLRAVAVDATARPKAMLRSAAQIAKTVASATLKPDHGYVLLRHR